MLTLYRYRHYILGNALADLRHRYTGTGLGVFWNVISPLVQIAVYAVVFTRLMKVHLDGGASPHTFTVYLCAGLLPWIAFTDCVTRGMNAFVENAHYLKKLPIPEHVFVAQAAVSATLSLGISIALLMAVAVALGQPVAWPWLLVPVACLLWQAFGFGLGLLLGTINTFIRDVGQVVSVLFQIWMWTLPIVYLATILPDGARASLPFNPPYPFLRAVQDPLAFGRLPPAWVWPAMLAWAVAAITLGLLALRQARAELRDVL